MNKRIIITLATALLLCSCAQWLESKKDRLDRIAGEHWEKWKSEGKDTTMCIIDFAEIVPMEWDTMVYIYYLHSCEDKEAINYMKNQYWKALEKEKGCSEESLHFWKDGKVVYEIPLMMDTDNEKGVYFATRKRVFKKARNNAKLQLKKNTKYFPIRELDNIIIK